MSLAPETARALRVTLQHEEGYKQFPYLDSRGIQTIGCGRNLQDVGISLAEALDLLNNDIARAEYECLNHFPFVAHLDQARKFVLVAMCFQLGTMDVKKFPLFLACVERADWPGACEQMLLSNWAKETPERVQRLVLIMRSGVLPL